MKDTTDAVLNEFGDTLVDGDVVILSNPYLGGMHLPDVFMFQPIFVGSHLLGYGVMAAHHNDRCPATRPTDTSRGIVVRMSQSKCHLLNPMFFYGRFAKRVPTISYRRHIFRFGVHL